MTALIDADSFLYKVGFSLEEELEDGTYYVDFENAKDALDGLIESIMFETDCDDYELWLTGDNNFRYDVARDSLADNYKHHRKDVRKPDKLEEMKQYLIKHHRAKITPFCEADDVVVTKKTEAPGDYILCAIDKDVLYQTEGTHWNYGKQEWVEVTLIDSVWYAYYQTLVGDTTDGYKGAFRIGPVKAKKILGEPGDYNERQLWAKVLCTYRKCKQTKEEALATMRLANMHQLKRNIQGKLRLNIWTPPTKEEDKLNEFLLPF
jgi:DNA polymerase-1